MAAFSRHFLMLSFLGFSVGSALAQTDSVALSNEYFNLGMEVFDYEHRAQAKDLFVLSTNMNPKNARAQFMAGQSIMLTVNKELSLPYFRRAWELDHNVDNEILYYLGQAYHHNYKFDSAILFYDRYNRILARSLELDKSNKINDVNRKIFECRNAVIYLEHPVDVTITHLSSNINSEYPDYAPTINSAETLMVFTSRRPEENSNASVAEDLVYYEDIYYSEFKDGDWVPSRNMKGPLNTNYHNSSVAISPDGTEMILYQDGNGGDLFISKKNQDNTWSNPRPMEGINSQYLENSASLRKDNSVVFFTSDRPGGYGGTDIYRAELGKSGRWTNITNLGPDINTEKDEDGVFISASGLHLYFSSNGHAGMGDMDLYRIKRDSIGAPWSEPVNLGYPINSPENDIYFVLNENETTAYISSVRQNNIGEQDIYKVDMSNWNPIDIKQLNYLDLFAENSSIVLHGEDLPKEKVEEPTVAAPSTPGEVSIRLLVEDAVSLQKLNAQVLLRSKDGTKQDLSVTEQGVYSTKLPTKSTDASIYKLEINSIGYAPQVATLYLGGIGSNMTISDTVRLQKVAINVPMLIDIYFAHDSDEPLSFKGITDFLSMMQNSPGMHIEIGGHTDSLGPEEYNQMLSQRRADAVKQYLVKLGVDGSRIRSVGYGESKPVASNDTQEGRRLNRRTEFVILQK